MTNAAEAEQAGLKVLVIDDSNTIRRSAEIFLKQGGYEVLLAEDGFDALSKVNDHDPDLIFCDILMPRLDGYQTCAIIKRNVKFQTVPIIMLSSKDGLFDKARGRMVGSQDYLTKPFTKDQTERERIQTDAEGNILMHQKYSHSRREPAAQGNRKEPRSGGIG